MPPTPRSLASPPSVRSSHRRRPLLGALMTGLLLLGTPAVSGTPKKKPATSTKKKEAIPPKPPDSASASESQTLYQDAANLVRAQQYSEALTVAKRCVDADPKFAECHMLVGAALSGMKEYEQAVEAYRTFLELAPDHRLAPKVRQTVEAYEKSKSP